MPPQDHHLKHQGRQQLGLFLKSIGLSAEDALLFWRQSFSPKIDGDKFQKEYAYNIRHMYGECSQLAAVWQQRC